MELDIKGRDGKIYTLKVPEGADPETIINRFSRDMGWSKQESFAKETGDTIGIMGGGVNEGISQILNLPRDAVAAIADKLKLVANSKVAEYEQTRDLSDRKFLFRSGESAESMRKQAKLRQAELEKDPEIQEYIKSGNDWGNFIRKNFDIRNTFRAAGIPVGGEKEMAAEGAEMTPLRTTLNRAGQIGGSALAAGAGPVAATMTGVGAAVGRTAGAEIGDIVGAPETGAAIGEAAGSITLPLAGFLTSRKIGAAKLQPPVRKELTKAKEAAYTRAEQAGVMYSPEGLNKLATSVATDMAKKDLYAPLHPKAEAALKRIVEEASKGQGASMMKLDQMRQTVRGAMDGATDDEIRLIRGMVTKIDEFMAAPGPKGVVFGDITAGPKALMEARNLARRDFNAEMIDDIVNRAENAAGRYLAGGFQTALKNETRKIVNDADTMRTLTPELRDALTRIVRGDTIENVLRQVGRMAPANIFNAAAVYGAVSATTNPILGAGVIGTGMVARTASSQMTKANLKEASSIARLGRLPDPQTLAPLERQLLGTILLRAGQEAAGETPQ